MEFKDSKTYKNIIHHRNNCKKWGKGFCLDCFGEGLTMTFLRYENELVNSQRKEGSDEARIVLPGDTNQEQGKTIEKCNMPGGEDNHADKTLPSEVQKI